MPPRPTHGLLRHAQRATDCVLVGADSSTVDASSALSLIPLDAARDGQGRTRRH